ncbi:MAG: hypothetical protein LCH95_20930 [Proteobacteria bacterium]|nr:hypothetical protein [Pseudomonadota bacterium]
MSTSIADERRLLSNDEYAPVARSHYPALAELDRDGLLELARWLRDQRGAVRRQVEQHRRAHRGKGEPRAGATEAAADRGLAGKKQVFARALKRVNSRLDQVIATQKRASMRAGHETALARLKAAKRHHPSTGRHGRKGAVAIENQKGASVIDGATIGSVSQAGRNAQARKDNR